MNEEDKKNLDSEEDRMEKSTIPTSDSGATSEDDTVLSDVYDEKVAAKKHEKDEIDEATIERLAKQQEKQSNVEFLKQLRLLIATVADYTGDKTHIEINDMQDSILSTGSQSSIHQKATSFRRRKRKESTNDVTDNNWPWDAFLACDNEPNSITYLVTASVLDGSPIGLVREAASRLLRKIESIDVDKEEKKSLMISSSERMLSSSRLEVTPDSSVDGLGHDVLRFYTPNDAEDVLIYAWTHVQYGSAWPSFLENWLIELGCDQNPIVSTSAGRAAGILWSRGHEEMVKFRVLPTWIKAESTTSLGAIDSCCTVAGSRNEGAREQVNKWLRHWGHVGQGIDGIFALSHLASSGWWAFDPDACLDALEVLMVQPNLVALFHAELSYSRLLARLVDVSSSIDVLFNSLHRSIVRQKKNHNSLVTLQVITCSMSILDTQINSAGQRTYIIDQWLKGESDRSSLAQLLNECLAPSPLHVQVMRKLRGMFMRNLTSEKPVEWKREGILSLLYKMHTIGTEEEKERIEFYLSDWVDIVEEDQLIQSSIARSMLSDLRSNSIGG